MRSIKIKLPRLVLALWLVFAANYGGLAESAERPLDVYLFWGEGCSALRRMKSTLLGNGPAKNRECVYSIWKSPVHPRTGKFLQPRSGISAYNGREYH